VVLDIFPYKKTEKVLNSMNSLAKDGWEERTEWEDYQENE
jgi:hypothetical protein